MSTICKLDTEVRRKRAIRRTMLRDMRGDAKTAMELVKRGHAVKASLAWNKAPGVQRMKHDSLLSELIIRASVLNLTLKHISKICLDPRRSGAAKEAILARLEGK